VGGELTVQLGFWKSDGRAREASSLQHVLGTRPSLDLTPKNKRLTVTLMISSVRDIKVFS